MAFPSSKMTPARDIGVSYFIVGIIGLLTYHIVRPWRRVYLLVSIAWFGIPLALNPKFTPLGHVSALIIGLALYPLSRGRTEPPLDPGRILHLRRRPRPASSAAAR